MFIYVVYSIESHYVYGIYTSENEAINMADIFDHVSYESVSWIAINLNYYLDNYL